MPVRNAILGRVTHEKGSDIGNAVVFFPALVAIADVDADEYRGRIAGQCLVHHNSQLEGQSLMFIVCNRRHDIHSVPDLVIAVVSESFTLGNHLSTDGLVANEYRHVESPHGAATSLA